MNFTFDSYIVHLTLNEGDICLRFEHKDNKRLYEATLTASDFTGCEAFGGLEAVGNIMRSAFVRVGATVTLAASNSSYLDLVFTLLGLVPIKLEARLFAKRRDTSDSALELDELKSKVAELERALAAQSARFEESLSKLRASFEKEHTVAVESVSQTNSIIGGLPLFKHKGKTYLRSPQNECWLQGPDNTMGAWQGIYNPAKDVIVPAPEPECIYN